MMVPPYSSGMRCMGSDEQNDHRVNRRFCQTIVVDVDTSINVKIKQESQQQTHNRRR